MILFTTEVLRWQSELGPEVVSYVPRSLSRGRGNRLTKRMEMCNSRWIVEMPQDSPDQVTQLSDDAGLGLGVTVLWYLRTEERL